jgi:transposase, IS30 family
MVTISERPAEAEDRAVPGFWEGDLIIGKGGKSQIATLVERTTRFTMLVRIPYDRCAERVAALLAKKMETLPDFLRNSVTWDQGKEMARHADFTIRAGPARLFLRPALTVAAWHQREHQTGCSGGTSRKAPTCLCTPRTNLDRVAA